MHIMRARNKGDSGTHCKWPFIRILLAVFLFSSAFRVSDESGTCHFLSIKKKLESFVWTSVRRICVCALCMTAAVYECSCRVRRCVCVFLPPGWWLGGV